MRKRLSLYRAAGKPVRYLDRVEDFWKDTPVKDITAGRIRASCRDLYPDAKGATWNRQVIVPTQAIINHAAEQELCPRITVKRWPVETKTRRPASWQWVTEFSSASSPHLGALAIIHVLDRGEDRGGYVIKVERCGFLHNAAL